MPHGPIQTVHSFFFELSRSAALVAIAVLTLQLVVRGPDTLDRKAFLVWTCYFDSITRWGWRLLHFFFPIRSCRQRPGMARLSSFGLDQPWFVWLGRITLILPCFQIAANLFRRALKMRFEQWGKMHYSLAASALALAFVHNWHAGGDLEDRSMQVLWVTLPIVALASFGWHRLVNRPSSRQR